MKENKPKVKDSQKFWDKNLIREGGSFQHLMLFGKFDKATYDRLVTLEAKIELLKDFWYPDANVMEVIKHDDLIPLESEQRNLRYEINALILKEKFYLRTKSR